MIFTIYFNLFISNILIILLLVYQSILIYSVYIIQWYDYIILENTIPTCVVSVLQHNKFSFRRINCMLLALILQSIYLLSNLNVIRLLLILLSLSFDNR